MLVWFVAVSNESYLNATLYRDKSDAIGFVRFRYSVPESVADDAVVKWVIANSNDRVVVDYDEI